MSNSTTTDPQTARNATLQDKVVLITGAARGIGAGIAHIMAAQGAKIVIGDLAAGGDWTYQLASQNDLDKTMTSLRALTKEGNGGSEPLAVPLNVTDGASCEAAVARCVENFGRLDVLVNNAGVVNSGAIDTFSEESWDAIFSVNTKGLFLMSRAAVPALRQSTGAIVNIASIAGMQGYANMSAYCGSKFAAIGITQALANELAPDGIRVNAVCPGFLATAMWMDHLLPQNAPKSGNNDQQQQFEDMMREMVPLGRPQTVEDIGEAVAYLAAAPNVTGVAMPVAGGYVM